MIVCGALVYRIMALSLPNVGAADGERDGDADGASVEERYVNVYPEEAG